jgi:hypothetical protein
MIAERSLKECLWDWAEEYPGTVVGSLKKGDKVRKSAGFSYIVDDVDIDRVLGRFPDGAIPYGPINRALRDSGKEIYDLFKDSNEVPFSRAFNRGVGVCVEKAILVQLSAQRDRESFLVNGCLEENGPGASWHGFNVVFRDGDAFLVDAHNPLSVNSDGLVVKPYIAPIFDIDNGYGEFIVPSEWRCGRRYSVI